MSAMPDRCNANAENERTSRKRKNEASKWTIREEEGRNEANQSQEGKKRPIMTAAMWEEKAPMARLLAATANRKKFEKKSRGIWVVADPRWLEDPPQQNQRNDDSLARLCHDTRKSSTQFWSRFSSWRIHR